MARFKFGTGSYDKKAKILLSGEVTVYAASLKVAKQKAIKLADDPDDLFLKEIEETPDDL